MDYRLKVKISVAKQTLFSEKHLSLKVLEGFGGRCGEVTLDGVETSSAEMDKVFFASPPKKSFTISRLAS